MRIALRSQILTLSGLSSGKVSYVSATQAATVPYITINTVSAPRAATHQGNDGTVVARLQVNCYESDYSKCRTLAEKIYPLCNFANTAIKFITLENEIEQYEQDSEKYVIILDFIIRYKE